MKALVIVTVLSLFLTGVGVAAPQQATEPAVVFSALQLLRTNHVDRPDPIRLLVAALDGLRQALSRIGVSERLADLDIGSEASARANFVARFNRAIGLAAGRISAVRLEEAAVSSMASSLGDPFNVFLTPEEEAEFRRGGYGGTGIQFRRIDNAIYIWHVYSDGPAARAGVREFDQIVALDGQSVQGLSEDAVARRIRGPVGSVVRFTVRRPGQTAPVTLSITRGLITPVTVVHRMLEGGVGLIRIFSFRRGTSMDLTRALEDLSRQGMRALILDLRQTAGGPFSELDETSRMILPPGLPIYSVTGQQTLSYRTAGDPIISLNVRVVVLVGEETVAIGELLAAAISEHGRGRLVGTRTPGRGGLYRTFDLPGGGAIQIKTGRVSTGKGMPIENGVRPDVEARLTAADLDRGQDPQLERARQVALQP